MIATMTAFGWELCELCLSFNNSENMDTQSLQLSNLDAPAIEESINWLSFHRIWGRWNYNKTTAIDCASAGLLAFLYRVINWS